ncbi:MAG: PilT/PilU family type 4a pilus ATPase [Pseudomonadota bacterium]
METMKMEAGLFPKVVGALQRSSLFGGLDERLLHQVASACQLVRFEPQETILKEGDPSDCYYLILSGQAVVLGRDETRNEVVELTRLKPYTGLGEVGLLMKQPRTATVIAGDRMLLLRFDTQVFKALFDKVPGVGFAVAAALAGDLQRATKRALGPQFDLAAAPPAPDVFSLLPFEFIQRHRVVPVRSEGQTVTLGCVDDPTEKLANLARKFLPSMELRMIRVEGNAFNDLLARQGGVDGWEAGSETAGAEEVPVTSSESTTPKLDALLRRMVAEGASDLHLSGGSMPRWRIDGDMITIAGMPVLGPTEVHELLLPVMEQRHIEEYEETNDTDFAYSLPGTARFRVNLYRNRGGVGTVMRVIPSKILRFEQLGLSETVRTFCEHPKGMVLVTGPTGSGKSTTMAAMIDYINHTKKGHIITLEDPIEFVHESDQCLINQREIGSHTQSFLRALRSALREDPDIVLVGELRDLETMSLAMEVANTGHLVFGTLHTTTAIRTIDRIIEMFPHEEQNQVRSSLADSLRGVVAQTLCKKVGGGRVAAYEVLVSNSAVANLIREGKPYQIMSIMQTGKSQGNTLLNDELARHVREGKVTYEEAMAKTPEKKDLAKRFDDLPPPS